jgi:hypothetical protein
MPSANLSTIFLAGLLGKKPSMLENQELLDIYNLPENPFGGNIKHLSAEESQSLKDLITAAEPDPTILLDHGTERSRFRDNAHRSGKAALTRWFNKSGIPSKINKSIEEVLLAADAHPRQLLQETYSSIAPTALPEEDIIHSDIELGVAETVFGTGFVERRLTGMQVKIIKAIMTHAWNRFRKIRQRMYKKLEAKKAAWLKAEAGKRMLLKCTTS